MRHCSTWLPAKALVLIASHGDIAHQGLFLGMSGSWCSSARRHMNKCLHACMGGFDCLSCSDAGDVTEGCRPCRSSSSCQPLSAPFMRQLQTRNLVQWGKSTAATVCHAGFCVPEAAVDKDSFCDRLNGTGVEQQDTRLWTLGAVQISAAAKVQQEQQAGKGGNRRRLQEPAAQTNTLNFASAPAPTFNITVPAVRPKPGHTTHAHAQTPSLPDGFATALSVWSVCWKSCEACVCSRIKPHAGLKRHFLVVQAQPMQTVVTGQSGVQNGNVVYVPGTAVVGGVATPVVTTGTQTVSTVPASQV